MMGMGSRHVINFYPFVLLLLALTYTYPCYSSSSDDESNTHSCLPNQQDALLRFKDTYNVTKWDEHVDCCLWSGISCDSKTGDVIGIQNFGLTGTINNITYILSPLYNLQLLDLSMHYFHGGVPLELSHFSKLKSLNLGSIYLSSNQGLTMESHSLKLLVENLTQLEELDLQGVKISGDASNALLNVSTALTRLSLPQCDLYGMFPESIFHLPNLFTLELRENTGLRVALPTFNWSSPLRFLALSSTNFSSKLPDSIGNLKSLDTLLLSSCHIFNPLPSSFGNLTQLMFLYLSSFVHSDAIPSLICRLSSIEYLYLPGNKFSGMIPQCLGNMTNLVQLDLSSNQLIGPFLPLLANCTQLYYLNVSANMISDTITHWPSFHELKIIDLGGNNFYGEIPLSICESNPNIVDMSNNRFTGTIPPCFVNNIESIHIINLKMNQLEGRIPDTFPQHCQIEELDLSNNLVKGPLPLSIVNCKGLKVLGLGSNNIEDIFPNWLESLPKLEILVLRFNKLHGEVKTLLNHHPFPNLRMIDISNNNLTGVLPIEYITQFDAMKDTHGFKGNPPYKEVRIDSTGNAYSYSMTITMKGLNLTLQKVLDEWKLIDFSNNNFQGEIPEVIGDLIALKGLNLSHNNLIGNIPSSIQSMTRLEWLDLSSNKLTGWIPSELTQLTELGSLNLSHNELSGMIPRGKQFDTFGKDSFVGNVGLCGLQIEVSCGEPQAPQWPPLPSIHEDDFDAFDWRIILMGYGCGLVIGISIGYIVLELRRPKWFVSFIEEKLLKKLMKPTRRANRLRRI